VPVVVRVLAALLTAHALYMQKTKATSDGRGKRERILSACVLAWLLCCDSPPKGPMLSCSLHACSTSMTTRSPCVSSHREGRPVTVSSTK